MKKIISAFLAVLMAASAFAVTSFADLTKADSSISLKSTTIIPVLKVTLPKSLAFVVNPYKMEIDLTTGKVPTASANPDNIVKTQVVPVYGTTSAKNSEGVTVVTPNTAWSVLNESGLPISCMLYAQATNGNPTAPFEVLDVNNSNKNAITGAAADATKRQLSLALMGKSSGGGTASAIKFSTAAPTAWTVAGGCTNIASIPNKGTLDLTLDTTKSTCKAGASCSETLWTAKDTATINVFFKFDFVA